MNFYSLTCLISISTPARLLSALYGVCGVTTPQVPLVGANKRFSVITIAVVMGRSHTGLNPRPHRRLNPRAEHQNWKRMHWKENLLTYISALLSSRFWIEVTHTHLPSYIYTYTRGSFMNIITSNSYIPDFCSDNSTMLLFWCSVKAALSKIDSSDLVPKCHSIIAMLSNQFVLKSICTHPCIHAITCCLFFFLIIL